MPIGARTNLGAVFWQDWINLVLGVWLFISPWVLGYAGVPAAAWDAWVFGVIVAATSVGALTQFALWQEWVNVVIGIWLLISPWVLGFAVPEAQGAMWNFVVVGIGVGVLALWDALTHRDSARMAV